MMTAVIGESYKQTSCCNAISETVLLTFETEIECVQNLKYQNHYYLKSRYSKFHVVHSMIFRNGNNQSRRFKMFRLYIYIYIYILIYIYIY